MAINKVANCIRLINLLHNNGRMTGEQLATALGIDTRTIRHYINDIYDAGIQIESIQGRYGGYQLNEKPSRILAAMTSEEYAVCIQADKFLGQKQFVNYDVFKQAIHKITLANDSKELKAYTLESLGQYISSEEVRAIDKKYYHKIEDAIRSKQKIEMTYQSLRSGESTRIIHPYSTFEFQSSMYVVGYCERRSQVLYFKCSRIKELVVLETTYEEVQVHNVEEMLRSSLGLFYEDDFQVKLRIQYPMSYIIKEKHVAGDQKITESDDKSIIFEAKLSGLEDIKRWVLSFGADAEVIEPIALREVIARELAEMSKRYV